MSNYEYASTQIDLPKYESSLVMNLAKDIVRKSMLFNPPEQGYEIHSHVTVLYGLHDDRPTLEMIEFIKCYPKFTIRAGKVSLFKGEEFDVVKLDVSGSDLYILNSEIQNLAKNTQLQPSYIPHITLAYINPDTGDHLEGIDRLNGMSFVANSIMYSNQSGQLLPMSLGQK